MFKGTPSDVSLHTASAVPARKKPMKSKACKNVILEGNELRPESVVV
jgi:hypothetical protein